MAEKKFSPMRYTASSEEAAVQGALAVVGAAREDVEYEVLDQSTKSVTVRIKPRSTETPAPVVEVPQSVVEEAAPAEVSPIVEDVPELLAQDEEPEAAEPEAATSGEDEEIDLEVAPSVEASTETESGTTCAVQDFIEGREANLTTAAEMAAEPAAPIDPALVAQAQAKAQQFLDKMGLEAGVRISEGAEANTAALLIEGADVGILIGKHGATLQSFQYLLNLTLNHQIEGEGMRVVVDAGNYRARRQSSLEQIARGAAAKARRDARPVRLDPMPAHERRLVHMFLQTEADIFTQSEGREPLRRIVISPSSAPRNAAPRENSPREGFERSYGNNEGRGNENRGNYSGMGSFARRNNGGNNGGNRGFNRGR